MKLFRGRLGLTVQVSPSACFPDMPSQLSCQSLLQQPSIVLFFSRPADETQSDSGADDAAQSEENPDQRKLGHTGTIERKLMSGGNSRSFLWMSKRHVELLVPNCVLKCPSWNVCHGGSPLGMRALPNLVQLRLQHAPAVFLRRELLGQRLHVVVQP